MSFTIEKEELIYKDVSSHEFEESLINIYAYLSKEGNCDFDLSGYDIGIRGKIGYSKTIQIPYEECIDCGIIYFHNPNDCGLDYGEGYDDEWICGKCRDNYENNELVSFESLRKELREENKLNLENEGQEEKCCICLEEFRICEINHWNITEKNVVLNPCLHILCRKCYYDLKNSNKELVCPLCRTNIIC
jgi:hypothetical protein